jgi:hypothetical protein
MSDKSYKDIAKDTILFVEPDKADLEAVLAFDQFGQSKSAKNIAEWLKTGHLRGGLRPEYIMCHATDGASNAVGSAMEFRAIVAEIRETDIRHYTCFAHQVNRSAKYASGTGDFKENKNEELSMVLAKMHDINGRIYRNETRLKVLTRVQQQKNRQVSILVVLDFQIVLLTSRGLLSDFTTGKKFANPTRVSLLDGTQTIRKSRRPIFSWETYRSPWLSCWVTTVVT